MISLFFDCVESIESIELNNNITANNQPQILLVEDSISQALIYLKYLSNSGFDAYHVDTGGAGLLRIKENPPTLVLLDLELPDIPGMSILKYIQDNQLPCAVVIITGHGTIDVAVEAMQAGAFDFLTKPFDATRLNSTVNNAFAHHRLHQKMADDGNPERRQYQGFIGASDAMQRVYKMIDNVAMSKASVFVCGESGTGKELCAEALHQQSTRVDAPFIALNCASIPKELMESEFFGHVKGAFTGAHNDRVGAVEEADGGTLFLDEICEMDFELQSKLLRFIQTGVYRKVGSGKERKVDIRFVCATNRSPLEEVAKGNFREDLYYRLHVIPISLPPLRERGNDVVLIANHLLKSYAAEENKAIEGFSADAEDILRLYQWPGNIRQMQNVIRLIVVMNHQQWITPELLPAPLSELVAMAQTESLPLGHSVVSNSKPEAKVEGFGSDNMPALSDGSTAVKALSYGRRAGELAQTSVAGQLRRKGDVGFDSKDTIEPFGVYEKKIIEAAISSCNGNVPEAATHLGLSPSTLYRKIQNWKGAKK
jgi:DNA-binding NtrC family response regulator